MGPRAPTDPPKFIRENGPGTWIMEPGLGTWIMEPGLGTWIMEPGLGTWIMEPGLGTWLNLDYGWGSTWIMDGAQPGTSGSPPSLRGRLKAG